MDRAEKVSKAAKTAKTTKAAKSAGTIKVAKPKTDTGCCPRFDPGLWDGKTVKFDDRLFVRDRVTSVFHIPLNFGSIMKRNMAKIENANAVPPKKDYIVLSDETSPWGSDVYIAASRQVPDAENVKISGTFLTRVFEGPYKNVNSWIEEMKQYVFSKGKEIDQLYFFYTTCPSCAKAYGVNYVVLLAKVE